jgi:hypothetical protein
MALSNEQRYFTGAGEVWASTINPSTNLPDAAGFRYLGMTDGAMLTMSGTNMTHTESKTGKELQDFNLFKQNKAGFELKLAQFSVENLQFALFGTKTANSGATVSAEVVVAPSNLDNSVQLANFNITTFTSLTNSAASTTYVAGTDYNWDVWGNITFPSGTSITASQSLKANYVASASESINAFAAEQPRLWVKVQGKNIARAAAKAPYLTEMPLAIFDPVAQWDLISTGKTTPEQLDLKGNLLYVESLDVSPLGSGRIPGGFFRQTQMTAA